jgi:heme A synthase
MDSPSDDRSKKNDVPNFLTINAAQASKKAAWFLLALSIAFFPTLSGLLVHGLDGLLKGGEAHDILQSLSDELMVATMVALIFNIYEIESHTYTHVGQQRIRFYRIINYVLFAVYVLYFAVLTSNKSHIKHYDLWVYTNFIYLAGSIMTGFLGMLEIEEDNNRYHEIFEIKRKPIQVESHEQILN